MKFANSAMLLYASVLGLLPMSAFPSTGGPPLQVADLRSFFHGDPPPVPKKAADLFLQAIDQIEGPTDIVVKSVETQKNLRIAQTEFRFGASKITLKTFHFDAASKLLWSDLFHLQVQRVGA